MEYVSSKNKLKQQPSRKYTPSGSLTHRKRLLLLCALYCTYYRYCIYVTSHCFLACLLWGSLLSLIYSKTGTQPRRQVVLNMYHKKRKQFSFACFVCLFYQIQKSVYFFAWLLRQIQKSTYFFAWLLHQIQKSIYFFAWLFYQIQKSIYLFAWLLHQIQKSIYFFAWSWRCSERSHVASLFTDVEQKKSGSRVFQPFATHAGHVYDVADTLLCTQRQHIQSWFGNSQRP